MQDGSHWTVGFWSSRAGLAVDKYVPELSSAGQASLSPGEMVLEEVFSVHLYPKGQERLTWQLRSGRLFFLF